MTRDEVWQHRQFRKFRFLHTELCPGDSAGYILPDIAQHTLEKSEGFLLIFIRSEEHTSELQSLMRISYAVFCLKTKKNKYNSTQQEQQETQYTNNTE